MNEMNDVLFLEDEDIEEYWLLNIFELYSQYIVV